MPEKDTKIKFIFICIFLIEISLFFLGLILLVGSYSSLGSSFQRQFWSIIIGMDIIFFILTLFTYIIINILYISSKSETNFNELDLKQKILYTLSHIFGLAAFIFISIGYALNFLLIGLFTKENAELIIEKNIVITLFASYGQIISIIFFILMIILLLLYSYLQKKNKKNNL
jgi:hypothetical protein